MTYLAEYIATPHEFTLAFLLNVSYSSLVTATTAQQSASIQAGTGPVTFSSSSTQNTQPAGSRTQPIRLIQIKTHSFLYYATIVV